MHHQSESAPQPAPIDLSVADRQSTDQPETASTRPNRGRRLLAAGTIAAAALGSAGCGVAGNAVESLHDKLPGSVSEMVEPDAPDPTVEALPADVMQDFEQAVAVDICETKVTAQEAADVYQRLFLTKEQPDMTDEQLEVRFHETAEAFAAQREKQGLIPLPANFAELEQDAIGSKQLPMNTYFDAAGEYLGQFGIEVLSTWDRSYQSKSGVDTYGMATLYYGAEPVQENYPGEHPKARQRVANAMEAYSLIPPALIREKQHKAVAFGHMANRAERGEGVVGLNLPESSLIIVDTGGTEPENGYYEMGSASHEAAHQLHFDICGKLILKGSSGDPALVELSDGFVYGGGPNQISPTDARPYATLADSFSGTGTSSLDSRVVAHWGYGMESTAENLATDLGEVVLTGPRTAELLADPRDTTIIDKKIAYNVARMEAFMRTVERAEPGIVDYYQAMFDLSRVGAEYRIRADRAVNAKLDRVFQLVSEPGSPDIEADPEHQRLESEAQRYNTLQQQVVDAMRGRITVNSSSASS